MSRYVPKKSSNSYIRALVLFIGLIIAFYFYYKIKDSSLIELLVNAFEQQGDKYSRLVEFTDEQRDSVKKEIAGFWTWNSPENAHISIDDRLELTDNGYIWQVEKILCTLPSGKKKEIIHATHAYLHPSSKGVDDSTKINCIIRILNQVWIDDNDTCIISKYIDAEGITSQGTAKSYKDLIKDIHVGNQQFELNSKPYIPYTSPDLETFFPPGIIEYVYDLSTIKSQTGNEKYTLNKKTVIIKEKPDSGNFLSFEQQKECVECFTLTDFLRRALIKDLTNKTIENYVPDKIVFLIKNFYYPMCLEDFITSFEVTNKKKIQPLKATFGLTWKGIPENVTISLGDNSVEAKWLEKQLKLEISTWRFQPLSQERSSQRISLLSIFQP